MNGMPEFTIETTDYGDILNETILKIFGDELTYNELKPYTHDLYDYSSLIVKYNTNNHMGFKFIQVIIDDKIILDKKYGIYHSCDMFYYLNELKLELE